MHCIVDVKKERRVRRYLGFRSGVVVKVREINRGRGGGRGGVSTGDGGCGRAEEGGLGGVGGV
jgi:hypothetical protein